MAASRMEGSCGRRPTIMRSATRIAINATRVIDQTSNDTCIRGPPVDVGVTPEVSPIERYSARSTEPGPVRRRAVNGPDIDRRRVDGAIASGILPSWSPIVAHGVAIRVMTWHIAQLTPFAA